ncbi:MAG: PepSY domain-containing protein [Planctomycetota bacterium]|nr:PepSY domain-containing protein [Planctomycetota bacterium]
MSRAIAKLPAGDSVERAVAPRPAPAGAYLPRTVAKLRRVHLYLGVVLSPFILLIAFTGIGINHFGGGLLKKLHSGKSFGAWGRMTVDLVALGLTALVITGFALWLGPKLITARRRRKRG